MKLEIEDTELIELIVTLKERLNRIEKKLDMCLFDEDGQEYSTQQGLPYTDANGKDTPETTCYEAIPTPERLNLCGAMGLAGFDDNFRIKWA